MIFGLMQPLPGPQGLPDSLAVPVWAGDCIPGGELGLIAVHKTDTLYDVQKRLEDEILGTDCPFEMISLVTWTESQKPKGTVIEDIHRVPLYSAQQDRLAFCFFANPLVYILLKSVPSTAELMKTNLYGAPDAFMLVDDVDASCCCFTGGDSATKNEQNDDEELKMQAVHNSYSPAQQMGLLFVDANHTWRDVCVMIRQELLAEANLSSALGSTVLSVGGFKPMQSEDEKKMKQQKGKAGEGAKKGLKGKEGPETKKGQENMEKDQETEDQDEGQEHTKKDQQDEGEGKGKGDKKKGKGDKKKGRGNEDEDRKNVSDESVLQEASHIDDGNEQHKNPTEASTSDSLKTSDVLQNPEIHQSANQQEVRRTPGKAAASAEQSEIRIHIDKEVQTERKEETKKAEQPHKNAPGGKGKESNKQGNDEAEEVLLLSLPLRSTQRENKMLPFISGRPTAYLLVHTSWTFGRVSMEDKRPGLQVDAGINPLQAPSAQLSPTLDDEMTPSSIPDKAPSQGNSELAF
ncbi:hypothetical protein CYMTET_43105 [Cymbomonas tetramitiformis]|uniref:Uncharacterized protein n=1 Tax=Cymbomonas tetramitiformis TaxID=36881 RepID=A0AAE0C2U3_9CHLO|nr:hypothetical protein CYMTET_43105 [Cymbomonas tetramitiformis]